MTATKPHQYRAATFYPVDVVRLRQHLLFLHYFTSPPCLRARRCNNTAVPFLQWHLGNGRSSLPPPTVPYIRGTEEESTGRVVTCLPSRRGRTALFTSVVSLLFLSHVAVSLLFCCFMVVVALIYDCIISYSSRLTYISLSLKMRDLRIINKRQHETKQARYNSKLSKIPSEKILKTRKE